MNRFLILFLIVLLPYLSLCQLYKIEDGRVEFVSKAPLEVIKASSLSVQGVVDVGKKTFGFRVAMLTFEGFNSPLQREHFFENYMEVNKFPKASFLGKILEPITEGKGNYRAKGKFTIHGVEVERLIDVHIDVTEGAMEFKAEFYVELNDHDIIMPKLVHQKIAEKILVIVSGKLQAEK